MVKFDDVGWDVLLFNYDDFRGSMSIGKGAVWGSRAEKAKRVNERKARYSIGFPLQRPLEGAGSDVAPSPSPVVPWPA